MPTMLRRLLMALLIVCLAAPAVAMPACHASVSDLPTAHATHEQEHRHGQAPVSEGWHECIGCIAPLSAPPAVGKAAFPSSTVLLVPGASAPLEASTARPDVPPPKA